MMSDKALANSLVHWTGEGGDTGKRRAKHRNSFSCGSLTTSRKIRLCQW